MRRFGKWVLTLGIIGVTPGLAMAGPLSLLGLSPGSSEQVAAANPNQVAAERIAKALRAGGFKGSDIQVQFRDGTAVLIGSVASDAQRKQVEALARAVAGVKRVENKLVVGQARPLPKLMPMRSVAEIPRGAEPSSIRQVSADVPAQKDAKSPTGIWNFARLFRSKPAATKKSPRRPKKLPVFHGKLEKLGAAPLKKESAKPTNQQVAEAIAAALRQAKLTGYEMEVIFKDGVATINGEIRSPEQKQRVSQIVAQVPGVKAVRNQLTVKASAPAPNNQEIANRIARALKQAKLNTSGIDVEVRDGVVKLTGTIADPLQKAKVAEIVQSVAGVKSVDNQLVLMQRQRPLAKASQRPKPSAPKETAPIKTASKPRLVSRQVAAQESNQAVAERIAAALKKAGLSGYDIQIEVKDGVATLRGQIASAEQKQKVTERVLRVAGVKTVKNELSLLPKGPGAAQPAAMQVASAESPQAVAQQIASALQQIDLRGCDITVRYQNGTATLLGSVGSPLQAQQAAEIASRVPGVRVVENRLGIPGSPMVASRRGFVPTEMKQPSQPMAAIPVPLPIAPAGLQSAPAAPSGPALPAGELVAADAQPAPAAPPAYGHPGSGASHVVYNMPRLPEYAWPAYAAYPNYAQLTYPKQYSASAWPYIGPFYPYPQIPLGWRQVQLEWDDGYWNLNFRPRTNKWWCFLNPQNW